MPRGHFAPSLIGRSFGRLTVIERAPSQSHNGRTRAQWLCQCVCGQTAVVLGEVLKRGCTRSCGCLRTETTVARSTKHGYRVHKGPNRLREYEIWANAKSRCFDPRTKGFQYWGGRGITMCEEWKNDFAAFFRDMGPCPPGRTLDRADNDGPYAPGNCRWATWHEQRMNQRRMKPRQNTS